MYKPKHLDRILMQNANVVRRSGSLASLSSRYLLSQRPLTVDDLRYPVKFGNGYASIQERASSEYLMVMDRLNRYIGAGVYGPQKYWEYPWVLSSLKLERGMKVLDAGCGTSPIQYCLADLGCETHGIDPNENVEWHGIDRRVAKRFGCEIEYRVEGMDNISYEDNTFDRVCCVSVIEHCRVQWPDDERIVAQTAEDRALQAKMMAEMIRILKPGGLLVLTTDFNFPRSNCLIDSNVDIQNLLSVPGTKSVGARCEEHFPGEEGFEVNALYANGDIDIGNYADILQTSIGLTLQKLD